jgi:trimeric autotransporter adhesin
MMKKNYFLLAVWVLLAFPTLAQNIAINTDGSLPNANAILDIKSGNKGILIPRLDSIARKAIPGTKGLLVYDTTTNSFWYNTGTQWQNIIAGPAILTLPVADSAWLLTGNGNAHDTINFLGTTNNVPLNIRVNNQPSGRIDATKANAFWGYLAGSADTGSYNTGIGAYSLQRNIGGDRNSASGAWSMFYNTSGYNNTANGVYSLYYNTSGYSNSATGLAALNYNTTGYQNTATGENALRSNTTGAWNTANGYGALFSSTTTSGSTATGYQALYSNTTGYDNVANGYYALYSNTTGWSNTASGVFAMMFNTTGGNNTAYGMAALKYNTYGGNNTAIGSGSLLSSNGNNNTSIGAQSLETNTEGVNNAAVGAFALEYNTTGGSNVAIGVQALHINTTGSNNTALGNGADVSTSNLGNATALGNGAIVDASNKVRIGNSAVTVIEGQVPFTTPSDGRYKFNVQEDVKGLDFILQLRPVTYQFDVKRFDAQLNHQAAQEGQSAKDQPVKDQPANYAMQAAYDEAARIRRSGFIAQEVEQAANATGYDFSGIIKPKTDQDHYSLSYDAFVVPLVKAIQEEHLIIAEQAKKINEQEKRIAALEQEKKIAAPGQPDQQIAGLQRQLDELRTLLQSKTR